MNQILDAPVPVERKLEYAGFWIRFVAAIIDGILLGAATWGLYFGIYGTEGFLMGTVDPVWNFVSIAVNAAYYILLESSARQATIGKMAVGIKVGDENGARISAGTATGRYFAKIISALILLIGYIMVAFDSRKQGLHDRLARTVVYYN